jgi:hypothetical protein
VPRTSSSRVNWSKAKTMYGESSTPGVVDGVGGRMVAWLAPEPVFSSGNPEAVGDAQVEVCERGVCAKGICGETGTDLIVLVRMRVRVLGLCVVIAAGAVR